MSASQLLFDIQVDIAVEALVDFWLEYEAITRTFAGAGVGILPALGTTPLWPAIHDRLVEAVDAPKGW